jgi:hypothetical protein
MIKSERSYRTESIRPRPWFYYDEISQTLLLLTPWGITDSLSAIQEKIQQIVVEYINLASEGFDITNPFEKLNCLSRKANHLRVASLLVNDYLRRNVNNNEFKIGFEFLLMTHDEQELVWAKVGMPHLVLLHTENSPTILATGLETVLNSNSPLPLELMGIESTVNLQIGSYNYNPQDRLFLLSHSYLPKNLLDFENNQASFSEIFLKLSKNKTMGPFWLAEFKV